MKQVTGLFNWRLRSSALLSSLTLVASIWCSLALPALAATRGADGDGSGVRIQQLMQAGRYNEAEKELRSELGSGDSNVHLKFLACVIQAQQGSSKKAIACFQQLVQDYPDMPEAYNNLGVLYAGLGMPMEARKWLERGLKQQHAYAMLYQNLQNLQAEINRNAYASALQLDMSKSQMQTKLSLLGRMASTPDKASVADRPVHPASPLPQASASSGAVVKPAEVMQPVTPKTDQSDKPAVSKPIAIANPIATEDPLITSRVEDVVQRWAQAWRNKDLTAYLAAYSPNFVPDDGLSRRTWENMRRQRISSKKTIRLELSQVKIKLGNASKTAIASFVQSYESGSVATISRKTLELVEDNGQWLITRESVIPIRP